MLYSQRWKDFWLHTSALYTVNPENDDDYAYGDVVKGGVALHYTPNYDLMIGIEMDASYAAENQYRGFDIGNTGGTTTNLAFVSDYRFLNAFGGNFKLRGSIGLPIYEDLNSKLKSARGDLSRFNWVTGSSLMSPRHPHSALRRRAHDGTHVSRCRGVHPPPRGVDRRRFPASDNQRPHLFRGCHARRFGKRGVRHRIRGLDGLHGVDTAAHADRVVEPARRVQHRGHRRGACRRWTGGEVHR